MKDMILNYIKMIYKINPRLISSLSLDNKSFMISVYSLTTASNIAVL